MTIIQKRVNQKLKDLGIKPIELSRESGVHYSSIKNIVQGKVAKPRRNILEKISNVLDIPPEELALDIDIIWNQELYTLCVDHMSEIFADYLIDDQLHRYAEQLYFYAHIRSQETGSEVEVSKALALNVFNFFQGGE